MGQFFSTRINPQVPPTTPWQSHMDKKFAMHLTHRIAITLHTHGVATMFDPTLRAIRFGGGGTNHVYGTI